jgi:predicted GNAT family N-acyltransferase
MNILNNFLKGPMWRNLVNFGAAIISLVINFIIIGVLGKEIPDNYFWIMAVTIIILISIMFFALWAVVSRYMEHVQYDDNRQWNNKKKCEILDRYCCGDSACRTLSMNYEVKPTGKVIEELDKKSSLFLQQHILLLEECFYNQNGKEILIVSSSLDSEVSIDGVKGASELVKDNLKNGVRYHYFCAKDSEPERVERNIRNIKKQYDGCGKFDFNFYDFPGSDLSEYLLYLFGIVIYIYNDGDYKAYFSIRRPDVEPIYRKMPVCMAGRYVLMLKKIRERDTLEDIHLLYNTYNDVTAELYNLRYTVFVEEQKKEFCDEFKGDESDFLHCCICHGGELIAGARVGKITKGNSCALINRIVVKEDYRYKNIGRKILKYAERKAVEQGYKEFVLLAQLETSEFFNKCGYTVVDCEFLEASIPHIKMIKKI